MKTFAFMPRTRGRRLALFGLLAVLLLLAGLALWRGGSAGSTVTSASSQPREFVARGRLEPAQRMHRLDAPATPGATPGIVTALHVQENDRVQRGQLLALMDSHPVQTAALQLAQADLVLARLQIEEVRAGAKPSQLVAQQALVQARRAQLALAQKKLARSTGLSGIGAAANAELEQHSADVDIARRQLSQALAEEKALTEFRAIDEQLALARAEQAAARLAQAQAELGRSEIRAPIDGTVLSIAGRPGSRLDERGLLTLGDLENQIVIAEFDERQAMLLAPGASARVRIDDQTWLDGRVELIHQRVFLNERPTTQVLQGVDARVVEVRIALAPSQQVPRITGLEVTVYVTPMAAGSGAAAGGTNADGTAPAGTTATGANAAGSAARQ